jgi:FAD/FMN-containing dehydrogenase
VVSFGGKVMKNVAGYDATKLFIGSFGTLGAITEMTLRLRSRPVDPLTLPSLPRVLSASGALKGPSEGRGAQQPKAADWVKKAFDSDGILSSL